MPAKEAESGFPRFCLMLFEDTGAAAKIVDPQGGGQDDRRFSTGHGSPVEKLRR